MVVGIKALSRIQVQYAIAQKRAIFASNVWHLISIHTTPEEVVLTPKVVRTLKGRMGCGEVLSLCFADVTPNNPYSPKTGHILAMPVMFDEKHAHEILDFAAKIRNNTNPEYIVVHCDGGISRSGAVACFLCDYLGLDYDKFKDMNRGIKPNYHVVDVLKTVSGMKLNAENSAFGYFDKL